MVEFRWYRYWIRVLWCKKLGGDGVWLDWWKNIPMIYEIWWGLARYCCWMVELWWYKYWIRVLWCKK